MLYPILKCETVYSWLFFLFMLDSGGWLGVRELVIFLLFLFSVFRFNKIHLHDRRLVFLVVILVSVCTSIAVNFKSLKIYDALMFSAPILIAPAFYLFSRCSVLTAEILCRAGLIFSYCLLVFYIGVHSEISGFLYLHNQLIDLPSAGYFGYTLSAVTGTVQPGFYFRSSLLLVPISLLYLQQNLKWNYLICFMAIVIADTRAGIFFVLLFSFLIILRRFMSPLKFSTFSIVLCLLFTAYAAKNLKIEEVTGLATRLLHVESITHTMENQNKIFGMGPSSSFYSQGFGFWTTDSEVSPLEYYRRYGIFGAIAFHSLFFYILLCRLPRANQSSIPLFSFYAASLTNPVMAASFAFMLYFGIEASSRPSKQIAGS